MNKRLKKNMRYLLIAISSLMILAGCNSKQDYVNVASPLSLNETEQAMCVETLTGYLKVDSTTAAVNPALREGIRLAEQNKPMDLLALLEKERENIYAHPGNTVEAEVQLVEMFITLYNKKYSDSASEESHAYYDKIIDLATHTKAHLLASTDQPDPVYYTGVLNSMLELYQLSERFQEAIETGEELCEYTGRLYGDSAQAHLRNVLRLSQIYFFAGMEAQSDSCIASIKHHPGFSQALSSFMQ